MSETPLKEINLKIEKLGVVHYFGLVCQQDVDLEPQICEDCGNETTRHIRVIGGWRDKDKKKAVWKYICPDCLYAYKSENTDMPVTSKLGTYNNANISSISKQYKPYPI